MIINQIYILYNLAKKNHQVNPHFWTYTPFLVCLHFWGCLYHFWGHLHCWARLQNSSIFEKYYTKVWIEFCQRVIRCCLATLYGAKRYQAMLRKVFTDTTQHTLYIQTQGQSHILAPLSCTKINLRSKIVVIYLKLC